MRPYADMTCEPCNGSGEVEVVTVNAWGAGWQTCSACDGVGSV